MTFQEMIQAHHLPWSQVGGFIYDGNKRIIFMLAPTLGDWIGTAIMNAVNNHLSLLTTLEMIQPHVDLVRFPIAARGEIDEAISKAKGNAEPKGGNS